ncbi:hypothetical protein Fmac_009661 [Flemingia macrophylla]|uniref:Uncharacterized protein n=1 Tax=Flemingia macrophylla TaxID=520843 RepID=A0ABD1N0W6_9FABA
MIFSLMKSNGYPQKEIHTLLQTYTKRYFLVFILSKLNRQVITYSPFATWETHINNPPYSGYIHGCQTCESEFTSLGGLTLPSPSPSPSSRKAVTIALAVQLPHRRLACLRYRHVVVVAVSAQRPRPHPLGARLSPSPSPSPSSPLPSLRSRHAALSPSPPSPPPSSLLWLRVGFRGALFSSLKPSLKGFYFLFLYNPIFVSS